MTGFLAVVLVCAAAVAGPDCSRDTALDVAVQPVASLTACPHVGQYVAASAFGAPSEGRYFKIGCERRKS